jgi:hypothetical protein
LRVEGESHAIPPSEIAMRIESISLLRGHVLVEPRVDPDRIGFFHVPDQAKEKYPQSGWVVKVGEVQEEIEVNDFVVFAISSMDIPHIYYKALHIVYRLSEDRVHEIKCDPDMEPVVRQMMFVHRSNPSTDDFWFDLADMEGTNYSFRTSQVVDFQIVDLPYPRYRLKSPLGSHFLEFENPEGKMQIYYLMHEKNILFKWRAE